MKQGKNVGLSQTQMQKNLHHRRQEFFIENQVIQEAEDISQTDSLSSDEVSLTSKKTPQIQRERPEGQRNPKIILTHQITR